MEALKAQEKSFEADMRIFSVDMRDTLKRIIKEGE
jgi:hypothetical protein